MKERPILFSAPMILSLLRGGKTQTRRVMKHRREWQIQEREDDSLWPFHPDYVTGEPTTSWLRCPYGTAGDQLWVRETWQHADWTEDGMPFIRYRADNAVRFIEGNAIPEADCERITDRWADLSVPANVAIDGKAADRKWRPSIFMPRWASRITLEITNVRVQRLWDISEEDAQAEGAPPVSYDGTGVYREGYARLWDSINGAASWDANPWVWAISFQKVAA